MIDTSKSYCDLHSPLGFAFGELGNLCSICSAPMQLTSEQVAMGRTLRNQIATAKRDGLVLMHPVGHDVVRLA